jgi:tetratricopeptide (TPR) repeat protein
MGVCSADDASPQSEHPTTAARFILATAASPSSTLEETLFADAADGGLDELSPLDAALVAGGVNDTESLRHYQQKAATLADELRDSYRNISSPRKRAESAFEFMHHRILRGGYHIENTDLRTTLDEGRFNCVSASVLFNYLAGELGLECRGLEAPSHVISRVILPDGAVDLETTCPRWFRMMADPRKQAEWTVKRTGADPTTDRPEAREVSPIQMAAMIYYNRGVDLLNEKRFAEAAAANAKAVRLDPQNTTARGNLLATLNNWSIDLGGSGHFDEAVDVLRQGLAIDPHYAAFTQNYVHVHRQWVERLCEDGQWTEASDILSRAVSEMPDQQYLRRVQAAVSQQCGKAISSRQESDVPTAASEPMSAE